MQGAALSDNGHRSDLLDGVIAAASRAGDLDGVMQEILETTMAGMGFQSGVVYLVEETQPLARAVYSRGMPPQMAEQLAVVDLTATENVGVFAEGQALFEAANEGARVPHIPTGDLNFMASVPLTSTGDVLGALVMAGRLDGGITAGDRATLIAIGREAGGLIARRRAEEALRCSEASYRGLFDTVAEAIYVQDRSGRFLDVNRGALEMYGYSRDELIGRTPLDVAAPGRNDIPAVMAMVERAFAGETQRFEFWGKRSNGEVFPKEVRLRSGTYLGEDVVIALALDVSEQKRAEAEIVTAAQRLRKALEETVAAMGTVVEMRDPYTAGHERRVTQLALAIAIMLGMDEETAAGLRVAADVHDIGKIAVPAEILSKPGRLTVAEFEIIKTHPQVGFDILKSIEFDWPVADIVLAHHERLDGSGYPCGLADGAIPPEARVLAVADVVEAMASHRPYREALGVEAALEEIHRHRGALYDADVVDACTALVTDGGFQFSA
jgi:PAS domain S-box-containing protein